MCTIAFRSGANADLTRFYIGYLTATNLAIRITYQNGTIFISAPTRDYNGTWDAGAVYVYTKRPNEKWTARTESAKIIPNTKEESGLFGYSLAAFQNTLIVGSPLNDQYKTGQVINMSQRRLKYLIDMMNLFMPIRLTRDGMVGICRPGFISIMG